MKARKIITMILCVALIVAMAASCTKKTPDAATDADVSGGVTPEGDSTIISAINYETAYDAFPPETVMLTVGGIEITWDLLYMFLCREIQEIERTLGEAPDLSVDGGSYGSEDDESENFDGSVTFREQVITRAVNSAMSYKALEYGAAKYGAVLTDDDRASIELARQQAEDDLGGHEAFLEYLKAGFMSYDIYNYLMAAIAVSDGLVFHVFGEGAMEFPDSGVEEYFAFYDLVMAKHILFATTTETEDGEFVEMTDEEKAVVREEAEAVLADLRAYEGDDYEGYFTEIMFERSDDLRGINLYPEGYLFIGGGYPAGMEENVRQLASTTGPGNTLEVKTTDQGYEIVYRIPVNFDTMILGFDWDRTETARVVAARDHMLAVNVEEWKSEMARVDSDSLTNLNLAEIFK